MKISILNLTPNKDRFFSALKKCDLALLIQRYFDFTKLFSNLLNFKILGEIFINSSKAK